MKTEVIDGVECYVFSLELDVSAIERLLSLDALKFEDLKLENPMELRDKIKEAEIEYYLAKDDLRMMRIDVRLVIEDSGRNKTLNASIRPEDVDKVMRTLFFNETFNEGNLQ